MPKYFLFFFRLLLLIFTVFSEVSSYSQSLDSKGIYVQAKGGFLMAHRSAMTHLVRQNTYGFELGYIKHMQQNDRSLNVSYRYPAIGANVEFRNFGYDNVLGQAFSTSFFFNAPLFQKPGTFIDFQYGIGLGYITKKYDLASNLTNNAIGSHFNAKVSLKLLFSKYFERYIVSGGMEIAHFSNGAITYPNLGLNTPSLFLQLGFLNNKRTAFLAGELEADKCTLYRRHWLIASIATLKQVRANPDLPKRYPVFGLRGTYKHQFSTHWYWEGGVDLIHNESNLFVYPDSTFNRSDVLQIGLYAGATYRFYKSEIIMGLGYYVRDNINPLGRLYNRIGYRFYANEQWYGLFNVRANLGKADFFEFGVGYCFGKR